MEVQECSFYLIKEKEVAKGYADKHGKMNASSIMTALTWQDVDFNQLSMDLKEKNGNLLKRLEEEKSRHLSDDILAFQIVFTKGSQRRKESPPTTPPKLVVLICSEFLKFMLEVVPQSPALQVEGDVRSQRNLSQSIVNFTGSPVELCEVASITPEDWRLGEVRKNYHYVTVPLKVNVNEISAMIQTNHYVISLSIQWMQNVEEIEISAGGMKKVLETMYEEKKRMGLTIVASNGTKLRCHKSLFCGQSHLISELISSKKGLDSGSTGSNWIFIAMNGFSEECLQIFVTFMYGKKLNVNQISIELVIELFELAVKFDIEHLKEAVITIFLRADLNKLGEGPAVKLYLLVKDMVELEKLKESLLDRMVGMDLGKMKLFLSDPTEQLDLITKLFELSQKKIQKSNELRGKDVAGGGGGSSKLKIFKTEN